MQDFINWCNDNQGFLLVVLTAIYVITTISIYLANRKNTKFMEKSLRTSEESTSAMYDNIDLEQFIQNQNVKLMLFDKRYKIYDESKLFAQKASDIRTCNHDLIREFNGIVNESMFLFENDLVEYLKKLRAQAAEFMRLNNYHEHKGDPQIVDQFSEIEDWLIINVPEELDNIFAKYLDLRTYGIRE